MSNYLLNAIVTLLVTIDPPGLAPLFVVLTSGRTSAQRRQIALRAVIIAGAVLIGFALVGEPLIGFLGISLPAFRIAGGLLLFVIAFEMVFGRREDRKSEQAQAAVDQDHYQNIAVFPLAIPLITGPAAISATILLASQSPGPIGLAGLIVIIALIMALCFVLLLSAATIERFLGQTGRIVVSRLLGLILAALAVQFVIDGTTTVIRGLS